ncbi:hypothetical protein JXA34_01825 [Patescibacteria group bacterium]|nr:hypothetical protein [Patescibacteria group bacterium]
MPSAGPRSQSSIEFNLMFGEWEQEGKPDLETAYNAASEAYTDLSIEQRQANEAVAREVAARSTDAFVQGLRALLGDPEGK